MTSTAVPRSTARLRQIDLRVVIGLALLLATSARPESTAGSSPKPS